MRKVLQHRFGCSLSPASSPWCLDQTWLWCLQGDAWRRVGWGCQHVWEEQRLQHASSPPSPLPTITLLFFRSLVGVKVRYGSNYREVWGTENICLRPFPAYPLSIIEVYIYIYHMVPQQNKLWISFKLAKVVGCVQWKQWVNKNRLWTYRWSSVPAVWLCDLLVYSPHENQTLYQH